MEDLEIFPDIEHDNNPLFYSGSTYDPYRSPKEDKPHESFADFSSTALVNSLLGLSQRIRKMLNNAKLRIDVISSERLANSGVMVYLIELRLGNADDAIIVKRRYSEFKSLRDNLVKMFPTLVVPPIPKKHTFFTYLINSIDNSKELSVVEVRKRYFRNFLQDLVFDSNPLLRNCPLLHKFLDPNYELCWENAVNEPPVSLIPQNLLLANPNDPTDQNGLYLLMPPVNGYDVDSPDHLSTLKKLNEDLHKLHGEINLFELKESRQPEIQPNDDVFSDIPLKLLNFEVNFHQNIKVLSDLHKLNSRNVRNLWLMITILIELGGNLNNFSLQIHEMNSLDNNQLSLTIEKFGSTIDSNFLNFEHFLHNHVVPEWEEPINQFAQYYDSALQLVKFYKFKLLQFKLLYKLKFNKVQELANFNNDQHSLKHLKNLDIDSPTIRTAIKRIELKQKRTGSLSGKKSWYGLFGGNKPTFSLPDDNLAYRQQDGAAPVYAPADISSHYQHKIQHIEKELNKLDQLIELFNSDMASLTQSLQDNFDEYMLKMEKKWLTVMLSLVQAGKQLFSENLSSWEDLKSHIDDA